MEQISKMLDQIEYMQKQQVAVKKKKKIPSLKKIKKRDTTPPRDLTDMVAALVKEALAKMIPTEVPAVPEPEITVDRATQRIADYLTQSFRRPVQILIEEGTLNRARGHKGSDDDATVPAHEDENQDDQDEDFSFDDEAVHNLDT